ncbi:MAG: 2Fe-2S iron-sulfur cluster-binding protein [Candidatus Izemoplasmatales bacterium]|jgi:carbon-monoxide dehydrogenase small subunit|nr:2Fe-2S iron-sulfur cluster-binding protein [Candidatus Izemoplasmatales bacterium]
MKIKVYINDQWRTFDVEPSEYLLDTLRRYDYLSVRRGCDTTSCGVCTVLLDGKPVPSCSVLAVSVDNKAVTTVEGIKKEAEKISHYFGLEGADQCGFCNPALALTVYAMKQEFDNLSDHEIREYLIGNLCRCSGYIAQEKAVRKYLEDKS